MTIDIGDRVQVKRNDSFKGTGISKKTGRQMIGTVIRHKRDIYRIKFDTQKCIVTYHKNFLEKVDSEQ